MRFPWRKRDEELDDEVHRHLEMAARERAERGAAADEAARAARREFGNVGLVKETVRDVWGWRWLKDLAEDARYGLRMVRKTPLLSAIIIAVVAISIGSGTAMYSLIDACLMQSITYPVVDRWVVVRAYLPEKKTFANYLAIPEIAEVQQMSDVFEEVGAIHGESMTLSGGEDPERLLTTHVTANAVTMTGVLPILGRTFRADEDRPGGAPVTMLSYELWQRRFAGDTGIVGKAIKLNNVAYTVIGVMPQYYGLWGGELWVPLQLDWASTDRTARNNWIVAVLRKDVKEAQANARLRILSKELEQRYGSSAPEYHQWELSAWNINEAVLGGVKPALLALSGAVSLLVLIGSANVATLLLSRMTARFREMTVRMALGASRGRILRQMLTESLLLAGMGGVCGVLLSLGGLPVLVHLIPSEYMTAPAELIRVNGTALAVALGLTAGMGVFFGLAPALQISRQDFAAAMKEGGQKVRGDRHGRTARNFFAAAEIALSVVVLAGAALMLQSYRKLEGLDLGFRPEQLLSFEIALPDSRYPGDNEIKKFYERALEKIRALPAITDAAAVSGRPMVDRAVDLTTNDIEIEGHPAEDAGGQANANYRVISPDYFRTMRIPLLRGRDFADADGAESPRVAMVNQTMARVFWPNEDPLGKWIRLGRRFGRRQNSEVDTAGTEMMVVGVVADAKQIRVIDAPVRQEFYVPLAQRAGVPRGMTIEARSRLAPTELTAAIRGAVRAVDAEQPIFDVDTMDKIVADSFGPKRLTLYLLTFFAAVALILCSVGLYGIVAYSVGQRTQEMGVRMAMGAQRGDVARLVVGQGVRLALAGLAVGLAAAFGLTRLMGALLYGVSATDPKTFAGVGLVLLGAALLASYVPARRATRVDPMVALRYE